MKRRYKLLLIIFLGSMLTLIISFIFKDDKINFTALGDGVAIGMVTYDYVGPSFNDYLKDYFENKKILKNFNNDFTSQYLLIEELNDYLNENKYGKKSTMPLKQIIAKSDIVTIAIGMDEFVDYTIKNKLNSERILNYLNNYQTFLENIRSFYDKEIIIISLYPAYDMDKNIIFDVNSKLESLAVAYKCKYLNIMALAINPHYYIDNSEYYINYQGHKAIYRNILKLINY